MDAAPAATMNQADFARHIGVGRSRVHALKEAGRLVMVGDLVDVAASKARINATRSPAHDEQATATLSPQGAATSSAPHAPPAAAPQDDKIGNSYQAARAVKERYLALEAKRAYEVACGQLMRADDVAAAVAYAATTLRTRLEALPDVLSSQLAGPLDEAHRRAVIAEAIEHILAGLSADFARITKDQHAPA